MRIVMYTYDETGAFFLGVPPMGGFLLDFSGELDPNTERSSEKMKNKKYDYSLYRIILFQSKTINDNETFTNSYFQVLQQFSAPWLSVTASSSAELPFLPVVSLFPLPVLVLSQL